MLESQEPGKNSISSSHKQMPILTYLDFAIYYEQIYGKIDNFGRGSLYGEDLKILQYILRKQFKITYTKICDTTDQSRQTCMNHYYAVLRSKALRHEADMRWRETSARYFSKNK